MPLLNRRAVPREDGELKVHQAQVDELERRTAALEATVKVKTRQES